MSLIRKLTVAALAFSIGLSAFSFTACSLSGNKGGSAVPATIAEDAPWYSSICFDIDEKYNNSRYDEVNVGYIGNIGESSVFLVRGSSALPSDIDYDNADLSDYRSVHVDIYDRSGEQENSIDVNETVSPYLQEFGIDDMFSSYYEISAGVDRLFFGFPGRTDSYWHEISIDPESGECEVSEQILSPQPGLMCSGSSIYSFGDVAITAYGFVGPMIDSGADVLFRVSSRGQDSSEISLAEQTSDSSFSDIEWMIKGEGDEYIFKACIPYGLRSGIFVLNAADNTISSAGDTYDWLDQMIDLSSVSLSYTDELGSILCDSYGLRKIDFEQKISEYFFKFDYCSINRFDAAELKLVSYSDERIVFAGDVDRSPVEYIERSDSMVMVLNRSETNPHAGKDIIRIAVIGKLDYAAASACVEYNNGDNPCFAVLDERYIVSSDGTDEDTYLAEMARVENALNIDMIAGEGPDILLNAVSMRRINSSDYLIDLSSAVPDGTYFDNVFDAVSADGVIYQMPLTCGIEGISTDIENIEAGTTGLTYDEYLSFVDEICNGEDPFDRTRLDFFCLCLDNMSDRFTDDGNISFDSEDFRNLAEFVNENINDPLEDPDASLVDMISDRVDTVTDHPARHTVVSSFCGYLRDYKNAGITPGILGVPSEDRRGPALVIPDSVAVNSRSAYTEECIRLVGIFLSDTVQECYAEDLKTPVSVTALEAYAETDLLTYNLQVQRSEASASDIDVAMNGLRFNYATVEDLQYYERLISSGDHLPLTDSAVMIIVREEIQAYFAGQKSLDEVIGIINDRVSTFVNERES